MIQHGIIGEDQWHNELHLAALENGIIGLVFSIMRKSLYRCFSVQKKTKKKATIVLRYSISFKVAVVHMLIITGIGSP